MLDLRTEIKNFTDNDWQRLVRLMPKALLRLEDHLAPGVVLCRSDEDVAVWRVPRPADGPPIKALTLASADLERCIERYSAEWGACLSVKLASELKQGSGGHAELAANWPRWVSELRAAQATSRLEIARGAAFMDGMLEAPLQRAIDTLCAVGHGAVLASFDQGRLHTFAVAIRGKKGVECLVGPDAIREHYRALSAEAKAAPAPSDPTSSRPSGAEPGAAGSPNSGTPDSTGWQTEVAALLRAVERQLCPVAAGFFAEQATLERLLSNPEPGLLSLKVASADVMLHPNNAAWSALLGADVGAAAIEKIAGLAGGLLGKRVPKAWLSSVRDVTAPLLQTAKSSAGLAFQPLATGVAPLHGLHRWLSAQK